MSGKLQMYLQYLIIIYKINLILYLHRTKVCFFFHFVTVRLYLSEMCVCFVFACLLLACLFPFYVGKSCLLRQIRLDYYSERKGKWCMKCLIFVKNKITMR